MNANFLIKQTCSSCQEVYAEYTGNREEKQCIEDTKGNLNRLRAISKRSTLVLACAVDTRSVREK